MYAFENATLIGINMQTAGHVLDWAVFLRDDEVFLVYHGNPDGTLTEPHHDTIEITEGNETQTVSFDETVAAVQHIICCYPGLQENEKALGNWETKTQSLPFPLGDETAAQFQWADLVRKIGQRFDVHFGPTGWYS